MNRKYKKISVSMASLILSLIMLFGLVPQVPIARAETSFTITYKVDQGRVKINGNTYSGENAGGIPSSESESVSAFSSPSGAYANNTAGGVFLFWLRTSDGKIMSRDQELDLSNEIITNDETYRGVYSNNNRRVYCAVSESGTGHISRGGQNYEGTDTLGQSNNGGIASLRYTYKPVPETGFVFDHWELDGVALSISGDINDMGVEYVDTALRVLVAYFKPDSTTSVTKYLSGEHGTVESDADRFRDIYTGSSSDTKGATARAEDGYVFDHWNIYEESIEGVRGDLIGTLTDATITADTDPITNHGGKIYVYEAVFTKIASSVIISSNNAAYGRVVTYSNGTPSDCSSSQLKDNSESKSTFYALPSDGFVFDHWGISSVENPDEWQVLDSVWTQNRVPRGPDLSTLYGYKYVGFDGPAYVRAFFVPAPTTAVVEYKVAEGQETWGSVSNDGEIMTNFTTGTFTGSEAIETSPYVFDYWEAPNGDTASAEEFTSSWISSHVTGGNENTFTAHFKMNPAAITIVYDFVSIQMADGDIVLGNTVRTDHDQIYTETTLTEIYIPGTTTPQGAKAYPVGQHDGDDTDYGRETVKREDYVFSHCAGWRTADGVFIVNGPGGQNPALLDSGKIVDYISSHSTEIAANGNRVVFTAVFRPEAANRYVDAIGYNLTIPTADASFSWSSVDDFSATINEVNGSQERYHQPGSANGKKPGETFVVTSSVPAAVSTVSGNVAPGYLFLNWFDPDRTVGTLASVGGTAAAIRRSGERLDYIYPDSSDESANHQYILGAIWAKAEVAPQEYIYNGNSQGQVIADAQASFILPSDAAASLGFSGTPEVTGITLTELDGVPTPTYPTNVGTYNAVFNVTIKWGSHDPVTVTGVRSTIKINPVEVTVRASDASKDEGESDPELTAVVSGTIGNDTISYTIARTPGEDAGTYDITPSGETEQGNYIVTYIPGTLTINEQPAVEPDPDPEPTPDPTPEPSAAPTPEPTATPSPEPTSAASDTVSPSSANTESATSSTPAAVSTETSAQETSEPVSDSLTEDESVATTGEDPAISAVVAVIFSLSIAFFYSSLRVDNRRKKRRIRKVNL